MASMFDAMKKSGLVPAGAKAPVGEPRSSTGTGESEYAEPQGSAAAPWDDGPAAAPEPAAYGPVVLGWAAAAVELVGKARLLGALAAALNGRTGRDRGIFDATIESAYGRKPRAEADAWRERLPRLGGQKGVPTFCAAAQDVADAVRGGACDAYMAEQRELLAEAATLVVPSLEEGEDESAFRARLDAWAGVQSDAVLKAMAFDAWAICRQAVEARQQAAERAGTTVWNEACAAFDRTGDFVAFKAAEEACGGVFLKEGSRHSASATYHAAAHAQHAWPCVAAGHIRPCDPTPPPPAAWLAAQKDAAFVQRCAEEAFYTYSSPPRDFRQAFRTRLLAMSGLRPDAKSVLVRGRVAIDSEGRTHALLRWLGSGTTRDGERRSPIAADEVERLLPTEPSAKGWVSIRTETAHGSTRTFATLYGPEAFRALMCARSVKVNADGVDVRGWLGNFGRHPQKGFGRFLFEIAAGEAHRDHLMVSVDDRVRDRVELLSQLPDAADAPFAEDVYYVPASVSKTERGGHLRWNEGCRRATTFQHASSGVQCSRRYIEKGGAALTAHRPTGSATAWTLSASTRKHDELLVVALVEEGQALHLDTGMAHQFDGIELVAVPGGALAPGEKPGA